MISAHQALCCLLSAVVDSAAQADPPADPFEHVYPTVALTWPYSQHHAVIGRSLGKSTVPPPSSPTTDIPREDPRTTGVVRFDRFDLDVIRCGPPAPDLDKPTCLGDLYGDCSSPAGHDTLAGHHLAVVEETERLTAELMNRWCDCMVAAGQGYSRTRPRWIEEQTVTTEGRFTAIRYRVGTLLG